MRIKILGKIWEFTFGNPGKDCWGICEYDTPNKKIIIDPTIKGKHKLEIILHELEHAADLSKDEEWVGQVAKDKAQILWKLGYRNINEIHDEQSKNK